MAFLPPISDLRDPRLCPFIPSFGGGGVTLTCFVCSPDTASVPRDSADWHRACWDWPFRSFVVLPVPTDV